MPSRQNSKYSTLISADLQLTEKERAFAKLVAEGKNPTTAAKLVGYNKQGTYGYVLSLKPHIAAFIKKTMAKNERMMDMSRKRVMDGFLEAIEQAKLMSEPMTQVAGWREIAKMCGYYAPEVKRIDINVTSQRVMSQLETLSDADLLELIEKDAEAIEGEARELLSIEEHTVAAPHGEGDECDVSGTDSEAGSIEEEQSESGEQHLSRDTGLNGSEAKAGAGEQSAGPEEFDSVREADVPEVSVRVGP